MSVFDKLDGIKTEIDEEISGIDKQIEELKSKRKQLMTLKRVISPTKRRGRQKKTQV